MLAGLYALGWFKLWSRPDYVFALIYTVGIFACFQVVGIFSGFPEHYVWYRQGFRLWIDRFTAWGVVGALAFLGPAVGVVAIRQRLFRERNATSPSDEIGPDGRVGWSLAFIRDAARDAFTPVHTDRAVLPARPTDIVARTLLAAPPIGVVALYIVVAAIQASRPSSLGSLPNAPGLTGSIYWIFAVTWAFALFVVAHAALRMGRGLIGRAFFCITFVLFAAAIALQGQPVERMLILLFATGLFGVISIGFAASALDTLEGGNGWPFKIANVLTVYAILFLPVGIWFLRGRIKRLLVQTAQLGQTSDVR